MNQLQVWYTGWGEDFQLGTLADNGRQLLFEYSQAALDRKLELSPVKLQAECGQFRRLSVVPAAVARLVCRQPA